MKLDWKKLETINWQAVWLPFLLAGIAGFSYGLHVYYPEIKTERLCTDCYILSRFDGNYSTNLTVRADNVQRNVSFPCITETCIGENTLTNPYVCIKTTLAVVLPRYFRSGPSYEYACDKSGSVSGSAYYAIAIISICCMFALSVYCIVYLCNHGCYRSGGISDDMRNTTVYDSNVQKIMNDGIYNS